MGILPLQFEDGESPESLGLTGRERFSITGVANGEADQVTVRADEGSSTPACASTRRASASTCSTAGSSATCCASCSRTSPPQTGKRTAHRLPPDWSRRGMSWRIGSVSAPHPQSCRGARARRRDRAARFGEVAVAAALRERLDLPLIAKDSLKEALGERSRSRAGPSRSRSARGVHAARAVAHELLANNVSLIAEGNFQAASALFVDLPPARIVQVHVTAEPALLRTRMLERAEHRHPCTGTPRQPTRWPARAAAGDWPALPLGGRPRRDRHDDVARSARASPRGVGAACAQRARRPALARLRPPGCPSTGLRSHPSNLIRVMPAKGGPSARYRHACPGASSPFPSA